MKSWQAGLLAIVILGAVYWWYINYEQAPSPPMSGSGAVQGLPQATGFSTGGGIGGITPPTPPGGFNSSTNPTAAPAGPVAGTVLTTFGVAASNSPNVGDSGPVTIINPTTGRPVYGISTTTATGGSIGITDPINNPTGLGNPFAGPHVFGTPTSNPVR